MRNAENEAQEHRNDPPGEPDAPSGSGMRSRWPLFLSGGLLLLLILLYFFWPAFHTWTNEAWDVLTSDDEKRIEQWVKQFGWWGPLLIIFLMVAQMFLIVAPTWALMVVAVLAYGPWWGVPLCIVSVLCASTVGYWVGRSLSGVTVDKMLGRKSREKLEDLIERHGFVAVILIRLAPFLSNDAISFVAGLVRMGYWRYILATFIGITPLALLIGFFGKNWDQLKLPLIVVSAAALLLYGAYVAFDRGWFGRKSKSA